MLKENTSQPRIHICKLSFKNRGLKIKFLEADHLSLAGTLKGILRQEKKNGSKQKHNNAKGIRKENTA